MNDMIKDLHVFGRLMDEKGIDASGADSIDAENRLYSCFVLSPDEITSQFDIYNCP